MADPASGRVWTDDQLLATFEQADVVFARDGGAGGTDLPPVLARRPHGEHTASTRRRGPSRSVCCIPKIERRWSGSGGTPAS